MDIIHRVSINSRHVEFASLIYKLGISHQDIELPGGKSHLITIEISESDQWWEVISEYIEIYLNYKIYGAGDQYETFFSEDEVRNASWLRMKSTFEQGYPQPKGNWPLKQSSYEIICPNCAIYNQIHSMRIAKEPHLGKKTFMSLIWASEIFCKPEVFRELKAINAKGYQKWDAIIHRTGKPSENVHQLFIPNIARTGVIIDDDLKRNQCSICGTTKYYPHEKGIMYLKHEAIFPDTDFMLTNEWFGFGGIAWREMLVSNRVATLILDKGWLGVRFKVVKLV